MGKGEAMRLGIVLLIALSMFTVHGYVQKQMGGVSGGDAYNYLNIAKQIVAGKNPFENVKRLPGYPLLLTPTVIFPSIDVHQYMRTIQGLAAVGVIILVYFLTRQLRLPWPAQLAAPLILAWQKDFFATSLRPEPYTLFAFLLLATLVLFFSARRPWQQILFGIALGYAAMVRQEGFVLAAILFLAAIVSVYAPRVARRRATQPEGIPEGPTLPSVGRPELNAGLGGSAVTGPAATLDLLRMFLPALIIVLPFFVNNAVTFGNPLYTQYFGEDEKLETVDSFHAFKDATNSTLGVLTSMWKPSWTHLEQVMPYDNVLVSLALFSALAWWIAITQQHAHKRRPIILMLLITTSIMFICWLVWLMAVDMKSARAIIPMLTAGMLWLAPIVLLPAGNWRGVLIVIVLLSQLLIATWFHPFPKHYQQAYPLIVLGYSALLFAFTPYQRKRQPVFSTVLAVPLYLAWLTPFALASYPLYSDLNELIDANNHNAALDSVLYRAARVARTRPGLDGFGIDNLPARFYFGPDDVRFAEPGDDLTGIETLVIIEPDQTLKDFGISGKQLADFAAEGKDEKLYRAIVYDIRN